jgi:cytochrome c-type biogenesis protein CcmF
LREALTARLCRWWLIAGPLAVPAWLAGAPGERALIVLGVALSLAGIILPARRAVLARLAAGSLLAATFCLAGRLLGDAFDYHYVWLYSAPELPRYLKLANLWGGDEGTLLLLATLLALAAIRLARRPGGAGIGALALAAWFGTGALLWDPFAPTPAADLARVTSRGMNAHLVSPWMSLHPPLIFLAYVAVLAPVGGAIEALATGRGAWPATSAAWLRASWLILSAGLFAGMWWAYEDFTFGQFWHWDPVQTSVFMVWSLIGAQLHGLGRYRADRRFGVVLPLLACATAIAALLSMAITRSPALASSHRYVGATSLPLLLAGAAILSAITLIAMAFALRRPPRAPAPGSEQTALLSVAIAGFTAAAMVAGWHLIEAHLGAYLGWPRAEHLKPFFETLTRWTTPGELAELRAAFAQWDVDRFGINAWLVPLAAVLALAGAHYFLPGRDRRVRWAITTGVAVVALLVAMQLEPSRRLFSGTGITSSSTTAIFPWLDGLAVTAAYLALSGGAWAATTLRQNARTRRFWGYTLPIAAIHLGVMLALIGGTAATVFDRYAQKMVRYPDDFGRPLLLPDGYTVTVWLEDDAVAPDGARGEGFRSVARVGWQLADDGRVIHAGEGHAVYRDDRPPASGEKGPVRLMCEILDYRYARYVSGDAEMIHPLIHRGLWRDVQVWLPAIDYSAFQDGEEMVEARRATTVPVVLKVYPLVGWLWVGLGLALGGAAIRLVATITQR